MCGFPVAWKLPRTRLALPGGCCLARVWRSSGEACCMTDSVRFFSLRCGEYRLTPHIVTGEVQSTICINRPVRDTIPNVLECNDLHQQVGKALSRRKDRNYKMSRKRGAKERHICVGDMVLVKCRKGGSKFVLPFEKDPWIVSDVRGTMITAKRGPESITQNISFYKKVYASDFQVPIDISSGDQDYDDVMLQSSGFETNDAFLDGGLCPDVQNPGGSMALDHGSGDQLVEESITSGSGLAGPVTSTRGDGPNNLRPRPQCSTRFHDFVVN
ncbi:hypothetical protein NDU88_004989 [Pleurodeles waltl]|uniref:Uncharacterized protein n=1 Tax=Pleurodeles waltl TaxID=8319 RepID=A0AAV7SKI8_PLEWA|nr:hypothetical protein NDU88_004989 [Pleurodeles waltl]